MNPKISVIIPCYNIEQFLDECLTSVFNQSFQDFEIICVEDCSTDNTKKHLEKYKKNKNVKIIYHTQNKGLAVSRNDGLKAAQGQYIFFLDSDDFLMPHCFDILYKAMLQNKSDLVMGQVKLSIENTSDKFCRQQAEIMKEWVKVPILKNKAVTELNIEKFYEQVPCIAWNKLYQASFLKKNKLFFIDKNCMTEDNCFWLKVLSCQPIITSINSKTYCYRIRGNSMSNVLRNNTKKREHDYKIALKDTLNYIYQNNKLRAFSSYVKYLRFYVKPHPLFSFLWYRKEKHCIILGIPVFKCKYKEKKQKTFLTILGIPVFVWRRK